MASLSDERVRDFLSTGTRTGKGAWVAANGAPHVAPIWFVLDGDDLGAERSEEYGERNGVPGELLVRLHPTKVTAGFDIAD